jgi:endonuclease YncB( thermonuclease family)
MGVRVYGVDTRELNTGATAARDAVREWIHSGDTIWLLDLRRDKYFRILADIGFACGDINQPDTCTRLSSELVEKKFAVPYFGDAKKPFPASIK